MTPRRAAATVLAVLTVTLTGACNGAEPGPTPDPSASQISAPPPQTGEPQTPTPSTSATSNTPTPEPSASPSPTPTADPGAAAVEVVTRYFKLLDSLYQDPDKPGDDLRKVSTGDARRESIASINNLRGKGQVQVGDSVLRNASAGIPKGDVGEQQVSVQVCIDVSDVDVVDKDGKSVVAKGRPDEFPAELTMQQYDGAWYVEQHRTEGSACERA